MIDVKSIISDIQKSIHEKGVVPAIVPMTKILSEVRERVLQELQDMTKSKEIICHETLNGYSFSVPEISKDYERRDKEAAC
ncbi:MAG: hypothetical protein ACI4SO_07950 [Muribaculaceae bacterium]